MIEKTKIITYVISAIIALSGWSTFLYTLLTSAPKIQGRVLGVIIGNWHISQFGTEPKTAIILYLYLTNTRKNPVHILDYELEFDIGNGYERAIRPYGIMNLPEATFSSETENISIPNFNNKIIYSKNLPVEYGAPLHGFALFATDKQLNEVTDNLKRIRITCIDAFNNRHIITYKNTESFNSYLLRDIAGITIRKKTGDH